MNANTMPTPESAGDLPAVGKPATRALLGAGIENLDDVARHSKRELAALHGLGPKALKILEEALAERGHTFASQDSRAE